ncbi:chemotaxis response regulator protein-glutamate methylesterase [Vogesella sp. DC21W]|uniref:Protein-glutamate methylesterase/protein-glutamine glutaminase n=1 Tax=Vogesella aquatica TaxID=2984206 RepID=A0ABT5IXH1_9NEIS|nr:chemotaxis response regulator protein-glutamate methylesterase [Vogesella aquatica]MDC7717238.1 chemotaxis response regulator protein-glutamate methylesterase [Vogesella aquatica]
MNPERKIRVVVVDDSALIRELLGKIINEQDDMEVVAFAPDPVAARERIRETNPDVITLDVEMPKMDGLEFLRRLMSLRPTPVLMISSLTANGSETALRALELGAVDCIAKPQLDISRGMLDYAEKICEKIRMAAGARVRLPVRFIQRDNTAVPVRAPAASAILRRDAIIVVGASTGGTEALREFLSALPADTPPVLVVQHMPENFTLSFARRLDQCCAMSVCEATDGQPVLPGHVYIAPGHSHLSLRKVASGFVTELSQSEPVNRHRPAVDVLFDSAANLLGKRAVGVILTGMGRDGAAGMLRMREAGAFNIGQDQASCVVYGMPRAAYDIGAVHEVAPLDKVAERVLAYLAGKSTREAG